MDSPVPPRSFEAKVRSSKPAKKIFDNILSSPWQGRLVGATMHEVNNRLAALTNLILLARTHSECSLQSVEYLNVADSQLRSLGEITSRSRAFIRLDTEAKAIDLVNLATSALCPHQEQIQKRKSMRRTGSSESALVRARKGETFQAVTNLLLNSIEALPHSGNLHVRVAMRRSNAIITIADNGTGIRESLRGRLFDFLRAQQI